MASRGSALWLFTVAAVWLLGAMSALLPMPACAEKSPAASAGAVTGDEQPAAALESKLAPKIKVLAARRGRNNSLLVEVEVIVPSGEPIELVPLLDGQPLAVVRPPPDESQEKSRDLALASHYTLTIPRAGRAELAITARTKQLVSAPDKVLLNAEGLEQRHVLYLLAVGVGRYARPDIPELRYPPKDARDLATVLQQQRPDLYRDVQVQILAESEASREKILERLDWLKTRVSEKDTAMIFLAGHGTNDADGRFYYLPYDAQPGHESMLSGQTIQAALRSIRGRVVLMLDTCHSGNVLGRESYTRLINELTSANRIVVFTAATGDQAAHESPAWQNGAFTKAMIEGLRGSADYTEDGEITMSELETWTTVRVRQLTKNVQTPTLAKPNTSPDYVLAALPIKNALPSAKQVVRRRGFLIGGLVAGAAVGIALGLAIGLGPKKQPDNVFYPMFQ